MDYYKGNLQESKPHPVRVVDVDELKAEAAKWVKNLKARKFTNYCDGMMDFIMAFFNLTEEDLK